MKQKNRNQKQKERKQALPPKKGESPNLLQNTLKQRKKEKYQIKISKAAFFLIILIEASFISVSLYNSYVIDQIERTLRNVKNLEVAVVSKAPAEKKIRDVIERIKTLKKVEASRILFAQRVATFVNSLPTSVLLLESSVEGEKMEIIVETATPLEVSLLISNYFDSNFANEIIIQAARLNKSKSTFETNLEVIF